MREKIREQWGWNGKEDLNYRASVLRVDTLIKEKATSLLDILEGESTKWEVGHYPFLQAASDFARETISHLKKHPENWEGKLRACAEFYYAPVLFSLLRQKVDEPGVAHTLTWWIHLSASDKGCAGVLLQEALSLAGLN